MKWYHSGLLIRQVRVRAPSIPPIILWAGSSVALEHWTENPCAAVRFRPGPPISLFRADWSGCDHSEDPTKLTTL